MVSRRPRTGGPRSAAQKAASRANLEKARKARQARRVAAGGKANSVPERRARYKTVNTPDGPVRAQRVKSGRSRVRTAQGPQSTGPKAFSDNKTESKFSSWRKGRKSEKEFQKKYGVESAAQSHYRKQKKKKKGN